MPPHFQEVAALILECAAEDVPNSEAVRGMLADLQDVRYSKVRSGLAKAKDVYAIKVNNLSLMEISSVRPFFIESLNTFKQLTDAAYDAGAGNAGST